MPPILSPKSRNQAIRRNTKALSQAQRTYRNYANGKFGLIYNRRRHNNLAFNLITNKRLKDKLNVELNVALAKATVDENEKYCREVEYHVLQQEDLTEKINLAKMEISHLKDQIKRAEKETFHLTKTGLTDVAYHENMRRARKSLQVLETQVEISRKLECEMIAKNSKLRHEIDHLLYDRAVFNKIWYKLVSKLVMDKKFLLEISERAILAFNQGTEICNQLKSLQEKIQRDKKVAMRDMSENIRKLDAANKQQEFYSVKQKFRDIAELEPREVLRRNMFRKDHNKKLKLYAKVLNDVKQFYGVDEIHQVIEKFHNEESQYFSNFNYMNEITEQVEILNASLQDIHYGIDEDRKTIDDRNKSEFNSIDTLNKKLDVEKKNLNAKSNELSKQQALIVRLMNETTDIFNILKCDKDDLRMILGDHTKVTKFNTDKFLSRLENKLASVISFIYFNERKNLKSEEDYAKAKDKFMVRSIERNWEDPTDLRELILTHQCPECAESEDVNRFDEKIVYPDKKDVSAEIVAKKLAAPEMRYRMHNISACRLPGSRNIVNQRYI